MLIRDGSLGVGGEVVVRDVRAVAAARLGAHGAVRFGHTHLACSVSVTHGTERTVQDSARLSAPWTYTQQNEYT